MSILRDPRIFHLAGYGHGAPEDPEPEVAFFRFIHMPSPPIQLSLVEAWASLEIGNGIGLWICVFSLEMTNLRSVRYQEVVQCP